MDPSMSPIPSEPDSASSSGGGPIAGKSRLRRWPSVVGLVIGGLCLAFLVREIAGQWEAVRPALGNPVVWRALLVAVVAGVLFNIGFAFGWHGLLRWVGVAATVRESLGIGIRTQVGKYLPGNVMHYAGRALLGRARGFPLALVSASLGMDVVLQVAAALLVGSPVVQRVVPVTAVKLVCVLALATVLVGIIGRRVLITWFPRVAARELFRGRRLLPVGGALGADIGAFLAGGWGFVILMVATCGEACPDPFFLVEVFALAWLAGNLSIGAPGGIGVREATIVFILMGSVSPAQAGLGALLLRLSNILADGLCFGLSYAILPRGVRGPARAA